MTAQNQRGGFINQCFSHNLKQAPSFFGENRGPKLEHRKICIVDKVDTDTLRSSHHTDLTCKVGQLAALGELLVDLVAQFLELVRFQFAATATLHRAARNATRNRYRSRASLAHCIRVIVGISY